MLRLKEVLLEKKITGKELAERLGVTPQYISGIVRETGSASLETLSKIAKELNVPLSSLFDDYPKANDNTTVLTCPHCGNFISVTLK